MRAILFLILFTPLANAFAQLQAEDLYSGAVPIENQGEAAREKAFPRALQQVLGKLSGLRSFDDRPAVGLAVENARSMVVSFHYEQVGEEHDIDEFRAAGSAGKTDQTYLVARFSRIGVDELMQALGLPRWPPAREPLVVWLLIDDGLSRRLMPLEYEYLRRPLDRVAQMRGLPLAWPEPGEDGDHGVDVQLLWGGYTEAISPQGSPGNVLVIAARREGREWSARLILEYGGDHWTWRSRHIDLAGALTAGMHQVIDEIAAAAAIAPSDQGSWVHEIKVGGITSGEEYARCITYLETLSVVDEVAIRSADSGGVQMALTLNAAPEYFEQVLADDGVLEYGDVSGHYVLQR